jgi:hypothetical protein
MSDSIAPPAIEPLKQAAEGLLFASETDAPLEAFFWPHEDKSKLTPETLITLAGVAPDTPIKSVKLETFFRPATKEEEWHNEEEKAQVARFKELVKTLKDTLDDVKVFRVGETRIDVYVVGKVEGGYAGLKTLVVET